MQAVERQQKKTDTAKAETLQQRVKRYDNATLLFFNGQEYREELAEIEEIEHDLHIKF